MHFPDCPGNRGGDVGRLGETSGNKFETLGKTVVT